MTVAKRLEQPTADTPVTFTADGVLATSSFRIETVAVEAVPQTNVPPRDSPAAPYSVGVACAGVRGKPTKSQLQMNKTTSSGESCYEQTLT